MTANNDFNLTQALKQLEEINHWFQEEDIDLEQGLEKLKKGKDLIKQCRQRLQNVENEFLKIKAEFAEETKEVSSSVEPGTQDDLPF